MARHNAAQVAKELTNAVLTDRADTRKVERYMATMGGNPAPIDEMVTVLSKVRNRSITFNELLTVLDVDPRWETAETMVLDALYPVWVDKGTVVARADNQLVNEVGKHEWSGRLNKILAEILAAKGLPMKLNDSIYGWWDYDLKPKGTVVAVFNVTEDHWADFAGTFVDEDSKSGITADALYSDGVSRRIRVEGSLSDFMTMMK